MEGLDTFGMIKLINFVRAQVHQGLFRPDASPDRFLEGNQYLKPVIEDDALLYSVDDIFDLCKKQANNHLPNGFADAKVSEEEYQDIIKKCNQLREQVAYYRSALQTTYLEKMELQERNVKKSSEENMEMGANATSAGNKNEDSHYFTSYAYNGEFLV